MITAWVALFEFGQIALAFCFPFILIGGTIIFTINETRIFLKEKKTNDNLEEIVKALEQVDIKTNVKKITKSIALPDIALTEEDKNNSKYSSYCYMFKDNNYKLRGLLEKDSKHFNEYYLLEENELSQVMQTDIYKENLPKIKKLVRRTR